MAIQWDVSITNVDVSEGTGRVTVIRNDSEDADSKWTHTWPAAVIGTGPQRASFLDDVWDEWQDELASRSALATFLSDLEATAEANLLARESE